MAEVDREERWELAVTVPPVTEHIKVLLVRCGRTVAEVSEWQPGWWRASETHSATPPEREDYEAAVADARRLAAGAERRRLLENALTTAIQAEAEEVSRG